MIRLKHKICQSCKTKTTQLIHLTDLDNKQRVICHECHNDELSEVLGVELDKIQVKSITFKDYSGKDKIFLISRELHPIGICLEANEVSSGDCGYKFAVHGELDCNQAELFRKLNKKVKEGIQRQYIELKQFQNWEYNTMVGDELIGRLEYDEQEKELPMVVVDGKAYSWNEFGKILKSNEGFQFKMKIYDITDDID